LYTPVFCVQNVLFNFVCFVPFSNFPKKKKKIIKKTYCSYSDLARRAHAKGHARAIIWYGMLRAAGARPKRQPVNWHGDPVPSGTTVPLVPSVIFALSPSFSIFFLTPSLSSTHTKP